MVKFVTDLPESGGNTAIMLIVDQLTKTLLLIPMPGLPTAFETAELIFNHVFHYFGILEDIVSDRGAQLTSCVWAGFMEKLVVSFSLMSGYQLQ